MGSSPAIHIMDKILHQQDKLEKDELPIIVFDLHLIPHLGLVDSPALGHCEEVY